MVRDFAKRGYAVDRNIIFERRAAEATPTACPGWSTSRWPIMST